MHCEYLYMGARHDGLKYILLLKDDLSGYLWLWVSKEANSEATAAALAKWISQYGAMDWLVTDKGSHFKNQVSTALTKEFGVIQHLPQPTHRGQMEQ